MALPANLKQISTTGFPRKKLRDIVSALKEQRVRWVQNSYMEFAGYASADFVYGRTMYRMYEAFELVFAIKKVEK